MRFHYHVCIIAMFIFSVRVSAVANPATTVIDCESDYQKEYPIHLWVGNGSDDSHWVGYLNYNDHPHAALSCAAVLRNLNEVHSATCAGVYDLDFDEKGNPKWDTVVTVKFVDENGVPSATFNAPDGMGKNNPNHPHEVKLNCSYSN